MEEIAEEPIALLERVTAPDIGKAALTVRAGAARDHARSPPAAGPHLRHDHPVAAGAAGLAGLPGVTRVVMEATSQLETAYLLEDDIAECWMVNARDVKNIPGRPTPTN